MSQILRFTLLVSLLFAAFNSAAQTTYTWTGSIDNTWGTAGNWSPGRVTPASNDILQFTDGGTYTVTGVPSQTIRQLFVNSSTQVSLQAAATNTLSINGPASTTNLNVASGASLRIGTGTNVLNLNFITTAAQQALIDGALIADDNCSLSSSVATTTFTINGSVTVEAGASLNSANASISFEAGSNYTHARNGGAIPTATWASTSTCTINAITNSSLSGGWAQDFGNILWDCSAQTIPHSVAGPTNVTGTFEVRNSNSQVVSMEAGRTWTGNLLITGGRFAIRNTALASFNLQVNNFTLDNSSNANARFTIYAGNNVTAYTNNLNVEGNMNVVLGNNAAASPVIEYRGSATGTLQENINLKGDFTQTGTGTGVIGRTSGASIASFNFNAPVSQSFSASRNDLFGTLSAVTVIANNTLNIGSSTFAPALATFTQNAGSIVNITSGSIANGGTYTMVAGSTTLSIGSGNVSNGGAFSTGATGSVLIGASGRIANTGTFALGTTALLGIASVDGITSSGATGNIQSTGARTYPATATYLYNGTANQVTGNGLPASLSTGTLRTDNAGNTITLSQATSFTGAGTLNLLAGRLVLGNFNLTLAATANLNGNAFG